ncbi:YdhR family protein [Aerosakkonemataceae cyanobacterium BLCC-F154]|uniref:YdhR family protein n=1 Tax=Floridaenema fluviatile BLCC-F154 TaxID=3153640 RepID=A0ABV4Y9K0_9CYAN
MSNKILQINFKFNLSASELKELFSHAVDAIAKFPGLVWKIWIINEDQKEAGGIYCFESQQALSAYLESPIVANLKSHPAISQISVKHFDPVEDLTTTTRGPVPIKTA